MQLDFYTFDFQSPDLEAEEHNYLGHHVSLAKQTPGLKLYYTGRLIEAQGRKPERFRMAILGIDEGEAVRGKLPPEVGAALAKDAREHLKNMVHRRIAAETIVPFDSRLVRQPCFVVVAEFDLAKESGGAAAEDHYLNVHTKIARRLPGLHHYMIGKLQPERGAAPERYRMAVLTFDSRDALRSAYASDVGQELSRDEQATIRNGRVWRLDARVEL